MPEHKDIDGAVNAFNEAIHYAYSQNHQQISTDALIAYREGISKTFGHDVDLVAKCDINKPYADNNRVESLNGTLRERVKYKEDGSPTSQRLEGQMIQYNLVKSYMPLEGQTPAIKIGTDFKRRIKLLSLLRQYQSIYANS